MKDSYFAAQFWQIAARRGKEKACLAVGHSILVVAGSERRCHRTYQELGGDWFARRRRPEVEQRRLIRRLEALGLKVSVEPTAA